MEKEAGKSRDIKEGKSLEAESPLRFRSREEDLPTQEEESR